MIGRRAKNVSVADALLHVAFNTVSDDVSARDLVMTGTPAGVGTPNNEFLKSGDVVTAWSKVSASWSRT